MEYIVYDKDELPIFQGSATQVTKFKGTTTQQIYSTTSRQRLGSYKHTREGYIIERIHG